MTRVIACLALVITAACPAMVFAAPSEAAIHWHGRLMVLGWTVLLPLGVLIARFFKVVPWQDWPRELDHKFWWRSHVWLQTTGVLTVVIGLAVALSQAQSAADVAAYAHRWLGRVVVALAVLQLLGGMLRGSKGGPEERGDHYDMTARRRHFEVLHKAAGYLALLLALPTTALGLELASAPTWMWLLIGSWWAGLLVAFHVLQAQGRCIDTYQAIWGPGQQHPGNKLRPIGWGIRRRD